MYDHIGLKVKDLAAAVRFYTAALAPLGHVLGPNDKSYAGLGPKGAPALWLYAATAGAGFGPHLAFTAPPAFRPAASARPRRAIARFSKNASPRWPNMVSSQSRRPTCTTTSD